MKKLSVYSTILIAGLGIAGCGKSYLDINNNPNQATSAAPEQVITAAMVNTASGQIINSTPVTYLNGWMGYWAPSGSYATNNSDVASYFQTTNFGNGLWIAAYHNLEDYEYVEKSAAALNEPYYVAMAKTMKSLVFGVLVDFFNNIPYSEAFQGTTIITPKYDKGQAIYEDLVLQLDSAVTLMNNPSAIALPNSDVMFYGDHSLWIQFANTLKLRLLMHQTQMPGRDAYITTEIAKIVANGGGFLNVDAAVNPGSNATTPGYANNDGQLNPLWGFFVTLTGLPTSGGGADYYRAASYSINFMESTNDPRLAFIYSKNTDGNYVGTQLGNQNNIPGNGTSSLGPGLLKSPAQNAILLSAAESHFLQAEALVRGLLVDATTTAQKQYELGVQASFTYLGAGDAMAYLTSGNTNTTWSTATDANAQISLIIRQKWMSENGVLPVEAYNDYRRLHLPANIPLSISPNVIPAGSPIPIRSLYPTSEYTTNADNVNAEGTIDYYTSKVFWNQ